MNKDFGERVSSLVDEEINFDELDAILGNEEASAALERFHLVSSVMHDDVPERIQLNLSDSIRAAIDNEPTLEVSTSKSLGGTVVAFVRKAPNAFKQAAGFAIAASVTAVTIFGYQSTVFEPSSDNAEPYVAALPNLTPVSRVSVQVNPSNDLQSISERENRRLNELLMRHNQSAAEQGVNTFMPYARVFAYPVRKDRDATENKEAKNTK